MIRGGRALRLFTAAVQQVISSGSEIVDLGTPERFFKELRPLEPLFAQVNYRAFGYRPRMDHGRYNCDGHQDVQNLTFANDSLDGVICLDVLEHVENPFQAAAEIVRVLRPGGRALVTVPFQNGYHGKDRGGADHDSYPDYWRMTHTGLRFLFRELSAATVVPLNGPIEFRARQFYLGPMIDTRLGRALVDAIDRPRPGGSTTRHMLTGQK